MKPVLRINKGILFEKDLSQPISDVKSLTKIKILKLIGVNDLKSLNINGFLKGTIEKNLSLDKECFIACIDNKLIHTSFIDFNYHLGVILFGDWTIPEYRGRHINPAVKSYIFRYLRNKGIKKVYTSCSNNNYSSKKSIARAGFKKYKTIYDIMFLGMQINGRRFKNGSKKIVKFLCPNQAMGRS